jgi:hypothetical protein
MAHVLDPAATHAPVRRSATAILVLKLVALCAAAIVAGGTFAIWRGFPPHELSASAYIQIQQGAIRGLNLLFPVVGLLALVSSAALALLTHGRQRWLFVIAILLMIVAALVTRFGNQPINAVVMGWSPNAPPADWEALRDRWWGLHLIRTFFACASYVALALGCLLPLRGAQHR